MLKIKKKEKIKDKIHEKESRHRVQYITLFLRRRQTIFFWLLLVTEAIALVEQVDRRVSTLDLDRSAAAI